MTMLQCATCGWLDLGLSDGDAEMKASSHRIKTGCTGEILRSGGRHQ